MATVFHFSHGIYPIELDGRACVGLISINVVCVVGLGWLVIGIYVSVKLFELYNMSLFVNVYIVQLFFCRPIASFRSSPALYRVHRFTPCYYYNYNAIYYYYGI